MAAIDTEQLIREVQKRRAIWDLRYPLYKDRDVKQSCWVEIMKQLFENVDDWTQREKEKTLKSIHQRWKSARDQYVRYKTAIKFKKSGSGAIPKRKYVFADCMSFLDPVTDLSDVHESESVENAQTSDNPLTQNDSLGPENDLSNVRNKRKKKNTQEMQMTTFEKQLVEMWNSTNNLAFDEDVAFFNSILSAVRRLDFEKNFFFRSQVLQLLVGINQDTTSHHHQTSLVPCQSTSMGPSTSIGPSTSMGPSTSAGPAMPSTSKVSPVSASSCSTDNYDTEDSFNFDFTTL